MLGMTLLSGGHAVIPTTLQAAMQAATPDQYFRAAQLLDRGNVIRDLLGFDTASKLSWDPLYLGQATANPRSRCL